jgi:hypothetical protein
MMALSILVKSSCSSVKLSFVSGSIRLLLERHYRTADNRDDLVTEDKCPQLVDDLTVIYRIPWGHNRTIIVK